MDLNSIADLVNTLAGLLPHSSPEWIFAASVLSAVAAVAHAYGVYRGSKAVTPVDPAIPDAGIRLVPPELKK